MPTRALLYLVAYLVLAVPPYVFGELSHYYAEVLTTVAVFVILAASVDLVAAWRGRSRSATLPSSHWAHIARQS